MARRKVDVREAAELLGTSVDAVRKRVQRGSLPHEKEDGRVYVWLDSDQDTGQTQPGVEGSPELVEALRDHIAMLRQEVEDWKEEARRKDTIIMSMTQRIPELEAAPPPRQSRGEPSQAAQATTEETGEAATPGDAGEVRETATSGEQDQPRSWWRRWFG